MNEKFSSRAKNALKTAQKISEELGYTYIGSEHLLFGIVVEFSSFASEVILKNKINEELLRMELIRRRKQPLFPEAKITPDVKACLERAAIIAAKYQYQFIGTEHFLYGIVDSEDNEARRILTALGIEPREIKKNLLSIFENVSKFPDPVMRETPRIPDEPNMAGGALSYFTTDLTARANAGHIDPLIGRKDEVERLVSILGRRHKNNPVLIGEPGVGKTAIVEGLALAIKQRKVARNLLGKRILSLDLALMVAGSMFRGEFENRLKQVLEEIKESTDVILFIDELHTLVGAGAATGSLDAANILKPALARGEIRAIGATTLSEYKKHIETDPALERRFQPIVVREPTPAEALEILKGLRPHYENHHGVKITEDALEEAIKLSVRYIGERFLPDKALDLIDETAAFHKMHHDQKNLDPGSENPQENLEYLVAQKRLAVLNRNFEKATVLRGQENVLLKNLDSAKKNETDKPPILEISKSHIAGSVARITGIPIEALRAADRSHLKNLEKRLKTKILGQDNAIKEISSAIRRSRAGISSATRPLGSFMFLGPSGVGKTLLAKILARELFGDEKALVRIDMSELMERHNVARLIGAPAGYVGFEEGGRLTETIRRKPYSIVLFDEMEKAHADVFNLLLQILEEGELTDAAGKVVNFRNTLIIMTSNIGLSTFNKAARGFGFDRDRKSKVNFEQTAEAVLDEVKTNLRTEFINRIDKIIVFEPIKAEELEKIAVLEMEKLKKQLSELGIHLTASQKTYEYLAKISFDPEQGARKIRKNIQEQVEDLIAKKIIAGSIKPGQNIELTLKGNKTKALHVQIVDRITA
ncbi:MAG: hypothetical protein A2751_05780 [Candidatus Doudnabacteria bacterium RIFCSPHIGHO2_01_FULL_46_14]|uniref:Clp R domain-containing protein n=1 Tax=Candidatus Doudnabacteria bacterium RIFCSPHIGHO2_01_FULL_46_14 TaxID=1817824 RepID=A0A1F5NNA2_9BACT|nr:MAG: hypothetical protein A2751_05780 [Candidatus Doudnabacteria bacterium RIFCSPHIGHO2_01_FULL_46_14]